MDKIFMDTIKDFINDSIKEATKLKETLSQIEAEEIVERNKEIINKIRRKSYIENRLQEVVNECNVNKSLEEYYKIGLAHAYGNVMYMLDQDFDKKDIKKLIMDTTKDDTQLRCDLYGVWGELMDKIK